MKEKDFFTSVKKGFTFIVKNIKVILVLLGLALGMIFFLTLPDKSKYIKLFFDQIKSLKGLFKKQDDVMNTFTDNASKEAKEAKSKIEKEEKLKKEASSVDTDAELKSQYEKFKNSNNK